MGSPAPFTFGVPLIARASAEDWPFVEALFELTIGSIRAQTQKDYRVIVAGHDRPRAMPDDPRFTFLEAHWPAEPVRSDNLDSGRKKFAINARVLEEGGGLLMFLDADDWVDARLVEAARAVIGPAHAGGLVDEGFAVDLRGLCAAPLPHPDVFEGGFHRLCGSCLVLQLRPDEEDPLRRDPYPTLHDHHRCVEDAAERGLELARLPVRGAYVINTAANHSELHGPFADWRRTFLESVRRAGFALDEALTARFGLPLDAVRAASRRAAR